MEVNSGSGILSGSMQDLMSFFKVSGESGRVGRGEDVGDGVGSGVGNEVKSMKLVRWF